MPEFTPRNAPSPTNAISEVLGFGIVIAVERYIYLTLCSIHLSKNGALHSLQETSQPL